MSIWNVGVAASNIFALLPLCVAWKQKDLITFGCIAFVGTASFVSHLFASHKHGQVGFRCVAKISRFLDLWDVLGCVAITLRLLHLFVSSTKKTILMRELGGPLLYCIVLNQLSEYDQSPSSRNFFCITHSFWHMSIFAWIMQFLNSL